jgi:hypothetical protein
MAMLQPKLSKHRFAVNIGEIEGAPEGKVRMEITVSRGGHTERRYRDFPTVFKGAFGKAIAMTEQQMVVAVDTYAMRALITTFFHITTDEDDDGEATRETNYGGNDKPHDKPQDDATAAQRGWRGKNVAQWADTLVARLAAAQSLEGIDDLLNTPPVSEWLADQAGGPTKEERTKISVARMDATKRVVGATPSTAAPDPAVVGRTMDNYDRGEARRKADQATETGESAKPIDHAAELIAHIASRSTSAALKSLEMEPEFLKALADLFPVDGERVQSFLVAKRTELEAKGV